MDVFDVAIVGAGPAGLALAKSCSLRGLTVVVIGDSVPWTHTLGTWVDDLVPADDSGALAGCLHKRWPVVTVRGNIKHALQREYALFDNTALAHVLAPAHRLIATVQGVTRFEDHHAVHCVDGSTTSARLVVDAGGARSTLLSRHRRGPTPVQSAYGVFTSAPNVVEPNSFTMMDWSMSFDGQPTFLYSMDLGDGRALVEETSLVGPSDLPAEMLRQRLVERLGGVALDGEVETVSIPMGGRLPSRSTTIVGFGAAGGFIHPVTGYSVAASLRAAPRVAQSVAQGLEAGLRGPALVEEIWRAVWPTDLLRTRALHDYGLSALRRFDAGRIATFFDSFFALPEPDWSEYLRIDTPSRRIAGIMTTFFASMPSGLRFTVAATSPRALGGLLRRSA